MRAQKPGGGADRLPTTYPLTSTFFVGLSGSSVVKTKFVVKLPAVAVFIVMVWEFSAPPAFEMNGPGAVLNGAGRVIE